MKILEFEGKTLESTLEKSFSELNVTEEEVVYRSEEIKGTLFKSSSIKVSIIKLVDVQEFIKDYLKELLTAMNLEVNFEAKIRNKQINIKMYSNNNSILIGKNGQTLRALQTIVKQVVYNKIKMNIYLLLDVENYKDKQKYYIERLAKKTAREVSQTKIEASLENMNSYERRIVHNVLTDFKGVITKSEGEEPNRYVVIKPN